MKTTCPIIILDQIDSTSSEVSRQLEAGKLPPFAIAAHAQSQGRGRRGKTWVGMPGSIFISLALDVTEMKSLSLLSLETAVLVARWLKKTFHFSATLKWPNDLFFQGKKIGGILCEASIVGDQIRGVVVGIGINVDPLDISLEYEATSIRQITSKNFELNELLSDLASYIFDHISSGFNVIDAFLEFGTCGSLWCHESNFFKEISINESGALELENLASGERSTLQSSHHDFKWFPQLAEPFQFLIGDFGNSRFKMASVNAKGLSNFQAFKSSFELEAFLRAAQINQKIIFIGNVANLDNSEYKRVFNDMLIHVIEVKKKTILLDLGKYPLQQLGIDRLAFMEGFLAGLQPNKRISSEIGILVSLGTATTIDCLRGNGEYMGGVITSGMQMGLKSLHEKTQLLPDIELPIQQDIVDWQMVSGTREAMLSGLRLSIEGAVLKIKQDMSLSEPNCQFRVIVTGGGARFFQKFQIDEEIILRGLYFLSIS